MNTQSDKFNNDNSKKCIRLKQDLYINKHNSVAKVVYEIGNDTERDTIIILYPCTILAVHYYYCY